MIYPLSLYNLGKVCKDSAMVGNILRALCKQDVKLSAAEQTLFDMIKNDNEWMNERIENKRTAERKRKNAYREKQKEAEKEEEKTAPTPENEEEGEEGAEIISEKSEKSEKMEVCPAVSRDVPWDKAERTRVPQCPMGQASEDACPTPFLPSFLPSSLPTSLPTDLPTNKHTVPKPIPTVPDRACAPARAPARDAPPAPPTPRPTPPLPPPPSASASVRIKRLDVYRLSDEEFFSPKHTTLDLYLGACGAGFWAKAIRAIGEGECREELNVFIHEVRAGESVKNPAAVMTKRLKQLAERRSVPL